MRDRRVVVAVDLGGTSLKAGVLGPEGLHVLERIPTARERGWEAVLDDVGHHAARLARLAAADGLDVVATGVNVPGVVDEIVGVGVSSATFGWHDVAMTERLSAMVTTPVALQHDVRAAARAEAAFGAAAGEAVALFVAIGTGIAATVLVEGRAVVGATNQAGEIGQASVIEPDDPDGDPVTLERVSSARAIADRYARRRGPSDANVDAAGVVGLAAAGDADALQVWRDAVGTLALALADAVTVIDPGVIVVGGGLSRADRALLDPLAAAMATRLAYRTVPRLAVAAFGDDAGFVGAALGGWRASEGDDVSLLSPVLGPAGWSAARAASREPDAS